MKGKKNYFFDELIQKLHTVNVNEYKSVKSISQFFTKGNSNCYYRFVYKLILISSYFHLNPMNMFEIILIQGSYICFSLLEISPKDFFLQISERISLFSDGGG